MVPTRATFFDTPDRTADALRAEQIARLDAVPLASALLEGVALPAALVNADREILIANERLATFAGMPRAHLVGRRLGEVLACTHAFDPPNGCGTTEACAWCGAAQALRECRLERHPVSAECRISVSAGHATDAIDARVTCTPLVLNDVPAIMLVVQDTGDAQRRQVLERMFFHDALNAAGGLRGLMDVWPDLAPEEASSLAPAAARLAQQLIDELEAHRDLVAAENGTLVVRLAPVDPQELLHGLSVLYSTHEVAEGKRLVVDVPAGAPPVVSDMVLLRRVLGNLVKNALEASAPGESVTLRHRVGDTGPSFEVHNPGVMPESARLQLFQRSFTTKGRGRGLGTYGSKLIAERHLGATLSFVSAPLLGTTFQISLPRP